MGEVKPGEVVRILFSRARQILFRVVLSLLIAAAHLCAQAPSEYEVKAAFLLNFVKFVEWSDSEIPPNAPISVCIVGDDPFGRTLDQIVEGETVGHHKVTLQRVSAVTAESACHVAYYSRIPENAAKTLGAVPQGVLTVGEGSLFLRSGGMIALVVENRRVRFDINMAAIRNSGLKVSSRLLAVARSVLK